MTSAAARENAELLEGQNRVLALIAQGAPLQETLDVLLGVIQAQCSGMLSSILLLDADGAHVRHGAARELPEAFIRGVDGEPIGPRAGSCGTAAFRREPVIVEDIATDPLWDDYRELALKHDLRACWSTPIFDVHRRVLGTFAMYFHEPGRPEERHLRLIAISTHVAAIAIERKHAEEEIARREAQLVDAQRIARLGSYEWDLRTNKARRSEELCRIFGLLPDQFEPTFEGYLARVHPEDRGTTKQVVERAFEQGQPFDFEERIVRPDGSIRMLHSQGQWSFDENQRPIKLVGICQDVTEQKQADQELRAVNSALAEELQERKRAEKEIQALTARLITAQEEERTRLAGELHDDLCQQIATLGIAVSNLKREISPEAAEARTQSERIRQKLLQLAEGVRRLSHNLHPAVLQYSGLGVALESYCSEFSTLTGIVVSFRAEGSFERLPTAASLCLYRIAQEALQNVLKHAQVRRAQLAITVSEDSVDLAISDEGIGIDTLRASLSQGLGLVSIKERIRLVNGTIRIESQPNQGTTLSVTVPLRGLTDR